MSDKSSSPLLYFDSSASSAYDLYVSDPESENSLVVDVDLQSSCAINQPESPLQLFVAPPTLRVNQWTLNQIHAPFCEQPARPSRSASREGGRGRTLVQSLRVTDPKQRDLEQTYFFGG